MDFVALDFETANSSTGSACSIGIVEVINSCIVNEYYSLINPETYFSARNVAIHGITKKSVQHSPTFSDIWPDIRKYFHRYPVVCHSAPFDRAVLEKTASRYNIGLLPVVYYDTLQLYKHNYNCASGLSLDVICKNLGIMCEEHHNALCDAYASACIMLHMLGNPSFSVFPSYLGLKLISSSDKAEEDASRSSSPHRDATPAPTVYKYPAFEYDTVDHIDFEESRFVITGEVPGYDRATLCEIIESKGGRVTNAVCKSTNYVISGHQDISRVGDKNTFISKKLESARNMRAAGHNIKVIGYISFISFIS